MKYTLSVDYLDHISMTGLKPLGPPAENKHITIIVPPVFHGDDPVSFRITFDDDEVLKVGLMCCILW